MHLLCLTHTDITAELPGIALLPHEVRTSPLNIRVPESMVSRFELLLVDGTSDIHAARTACFELNAECSVPRLLVCKETALTVITQDWGLTDVLLPSASPAEIELRLRLALGRHTAASQADRVNSVSAAGVVIDEGNFTARVQNRMLDLTYKEFELLHFLTRNPDRVFTREHLLSEVWGMDYYGGTRTVDVHVRRLRAKLGEHEGLISTVRGVGYGFARDQHESNEDD